MNDEQFEKRMRLLKDSYDRVPSSFDSEEVLREIEETPQKEPQEIMQPRKLRKFKRSAVVWAVSVASLFLIVILSAAYFATAPEELADGKQSELSKSELFAFEKEYEEEREKKRLILGVTEAQFAKINFVERTDKNVKHLLKTSLITKGNRKQLLQDRFAEMALPSELTNELLKNPLQDDQEASLAFVTQYRNQVHDLIDFYNKLFIENGEIKASVLSEMSKQRIQYLINNPKTQYATTDFQLVESAEIREALHEDVKAYYDMLLEEPYTIGASFIYSIKETAGIVKEMEAALIATKEESHLYLVMRGYYVSLFNQLVKGSPEEPVFDDEGIVNEAYQKAWTQLANAENNTPTSFIMRPIVEEMEASGWQKATSLDAFNYGEMESMLVLAENGMLPN